MLCSRYRYNSSTILVPLALCKTTETEQTVFSNKAEYKYLYLCDIILVILIPHIGGLGHLNSKRLFCKIFPHVICVNTTNN